jgi:light-regulated signal transduction histidine kinase (bacteriophytochrome)
MAEEALNQANRKINLLTFVTFNEIQNAVFSLAGYLELEKQSGLDEPVRDFVGKQEVILKSIRQSLDFSKKYQSLGLVPPRWQKITHTFLFGTSHLSLQELTRNIIVDNLEIFADPMLEDCFYTLAENVLVHGKKATEISLRYTESAAGLTLIFEDNGIGVPDDLKEAIFTRKYEDKKGLGLFLTREILGITDITIRETGTYGEGARFEIFVPKGKYRIGKDQNSREPV